MLISSCRDFVEEKLGSKYVMGRALDFVASFEESGPATPMFFILSPGVDPLKDVESHGEESLVWSQSFGTLCLSFIGSIAFSFLQLRISF